MSKTIAPIFNLTKKDFLFLKALSDLNKAIIADGSAFADHVFSKKMSAMIKSAGFNLHDQAMRLVISNDKYVFKFNDLFDQNKKEEAVAIQFKPFKINEWKVSAPKFYGSMFGGNVLIFEKVKRPSRYAKNSARYNFYSPFNLLLRRIGKRINVGDLNFENVFLFQKEKKIIIVDLGIDRSDYS